VVANVNDLPTGSVTLSGITAVGQTLMAANTLADEDGLGAITYTWFRSGSATPLATGASYLLTPADTGQTLTAVASYTDALGSDESVASAPSATVANLNNPPTGSVIVVGTPAVGVSLSAFNNLADADGLGAISYQWFADGVAIGGATGNIFQPTLAEYRKVITVSANYTDQGGYPEAVSSSPTTPVRNPGDLLQGTPGPDTLTGGDRDDTLVGFDGQDTLRGNGGDDQIDGGGDIDTAVYAGELLDYTLVRDGTAFEISGPLAEGFDQLVNVERLQFNDLSLAFDLDGHAGEVAKLLGAMIGKDEWYVREYVGIGLDILDEGFSFEELMTVALEVVLGANPSNAAVVNLLWDNLVGGPTPVEVLNDLVGILERGELTQVGLCLAAADHPVNLDNIGLVGLVSSGLEYIPL
jgi:hypothetical protein